MKVFSFATSFLLGICWKSINIDALKGKCGKAKGLEGSGSWNASVPWAASIIAPNGKEQWAGIIISPQIILTDELYFTDVIKHKLKFNRTETFVAVVNTSHWGSTEGAQVIPVTQIRYQPSFHMGIWPKARNVVALVHLSHPILNSPTVMPVCLPQTQEEIEEITTSGNIILTGWNRNITDRLYSLQLSILPKEECRKDWNSEPDIGGAVYQQRYCAIVNKNNHHDKCIHRDNAAVRSINGSFYLGGFVNNFYSVNQSGICGEGALFFIFNFKEKVYNWIQENIKCGANNFTCDSGQCINLLDVCNGSTECKDGSDESSLLCGGPETNPAWSTFELVIISFTALIAVICTIILSIASLKVCYKKYSEGVRWSRVDN